MAISFEDECSHKRLKEQYDKCIGLTKQIARVVTTIKDVSSQSRELASKLDEASESCERLSESLELIAQCFPKGHLARELINKDVDNIKVQLRWFKGQLQSMSTRLTVNVGELMVKDQNECRAYAHHLRRAYKSEYGQLYSGRKIMPLRVLKTKSTETVSDKKLGLKRCKRIHLRRPLLTRDQLLDTALYFREAMKHLTLCQADQAQMIARRLRVITEALKFMLTDGKALFAFDNERSSSPTEVPTAPHEDENMSGLYGTELAATHLPLYSLTYGDKMQEKYRAVKIGEQPEIVQSSSARDRLPLTAKDICKRKKAILDADVRQGPVGSSKAEVCVNKEEVRHEKSDDGTVSKTVTNFTTYASLLSVKTITFDDPEVVITSVSDYINEATEHEAIPSVKAEEPASSNKSGLRTVRSGLTIDLRGTDSTAMRSLTGQMDSLELSSAGDKEEATTVWIRQGRNSVNQEIADGETSELSEEYMFEMPRSRVAALVKLFENLK